MTGEILILAHATDAGASSVAARLGAGPRALPVRVVRPEALGLARWSHRVDPTGRASTQLTLPGLQPLGSSLLAVLNRVRYLSVPHFRTSSARDRDYAASELQALVASWLCGLGELVVQPIRTHPWVTPWLSRQRWVSAAAEAGLPVQERRLTFPPLGFLPGELAEAVPFEAADQHTVLVAGSAVRGSLAGRYGSGCLAAALTIGFPLLEFRFAANGDGPRLVDVDPLPALHEPWAAAMAADFLRARAASLS